MDDLDNVIVPFPAPTPSAPVVGVSDVAGLLALWLADVAVETIQRPEIAEPDPPAPE